MPVLRVTQPQSNIKKFYLPSTSKYVDANGVSQKTPIEQQAWVNVDVGPESVLDWQVVTDEDQNSALRKARIIIRRIKEWNFVDENNMPVPITFESFWSLPDEDRLYLLTIQFDEGQKSLTLDEKKS